MKKNIEKTKEEYSMNYDNIIQIKIKCEDRNEKIKEQIQCKTRKKDIVIV